MRSTYLAGALLLATDAATAYSLTLPSRPMAVTAPAARRSAAALIKVRKACLPSSTFTHAAAAACTDSALHLFPPIQLTDFCDFVCRA